MLRHTMSMRVFVFSAVILSLILFLLTANSTVSAAEFTVVSETGPQTKDAESGFDNPILTGRNAATPCQIRMQGDIVEGDLNRLKQALSQFRAKRGDNPDLPNHVGLCLASRGGSYMEAIRIAKAMLGKPQTEEDEDSLTGPLRTWTVVGDGDECYSACAIIFMAGNIYIVDEMIGPYSERHLHVRGKLGFHSPYLAFPASASETYTADTVKKAFREGALAVRELVRLGEKVNNGGQADDPSLLPQKLITEMLAHGEDDLYFIDRVGKAVVHSIDLFGADRPQRIGACEYDDICGAAHTSKQYASWVDEPTRTTNCSKHWKTLKGKYLFSGDGGIGDNTGGYGAEGLMYCVLMKTGDAANPIQYAAELIESQQSSLNLNFLDPPWWFYYPPATPLNTLK
ncbi:MAG: hypothetical protein KJ558_05875 [Gammaproteobacteria bacterium]|nr:hypothetical protein [Gammaproteobacteria bacterium]MBU1654345.1 hypothetical protein [Gammaproteobacteria bacterium]MBU1962663.1 hypothetical protein [Gammaproteobacteria bacterium]